MENTVEKRRRLLKSEIELAENLLITNAKRVSFSKYLVPSSDMVKAGIEGVLSDPQKSVESLDMISRSLLPKSHLIRKVLKYINLAWKLMDNFAPADSKPLTTAN